MFFFGRIILVILGLLVMYLIIRHDTIRLICIIFTYPHTRYLNAIDFIFVAESVDASAQPQTRAKSLLDL